MSYRPRLPRGVCPTCDTDVALHIHVDWEIPEPRGQAVGQPAHHSDGVARCSSPSMQWRWHALNPGADGERRYRAVGPDAEARLDEGRVPPAVLDEIIAAAGRPSDWPGRGPKQAPLSTDALRAIDGALDRLGLDP